MLDHFHNEAFVAYEIVTLAVVITTYSGIYLGKLGGANLQTTIAAAVSGGLCSGITMTMMKVMAIGTMAMNGTFRSPL